MREYTTPTFIFAFPFDLAQIDAMKISITQGTTVLKKTMDDGTVQGSKFGLTLTQAESGAFAPGSAYGQIKILKGATVLGTKRFMLRITPMDDQTPWEIPSGEGDTPPEAFDILPEESRDNPDEILLDEYPQEIIVEFTEVYQISNTVADWDDIDGKPDTFPPAPHTHPATEVNVNDTELPTDARNVQEALDGLAEEVSDVRSIATGASASISEHAEDIIFHRQDYLSEKYHVKDAERAAWDAKYTKPSGGIPAADLTEDARADLLKAATAVQPADLDPYATEAFVNSSIATNTAYFRGTFSSVQALEEYSGPKTNNDYAYVVVMDPVEPTEVKQYDRYKYNGTAWVYEYTLNNSSFTAEQWAAINSGVNATKISTYDGYAAQIAAKQTALDSDQLEAVNSGINATKVGTYDGYANTIANKEDASNKVTIIDAQSTNVQYAGAKAVYDFVDGVVGNINSILATI